MNFLFATNSTPPSQSLSCNTSLGPCSAQTSPGAASPTPSSASLQDIELVIDIESSFHGVLLGMPEESSGAVLNATAILHVRKKPIRATKLTATFDGRIKVQCSDGATFGPEQYRERVLAHKDWVLWEAGSNTHNTTSGSGSKNHIPVGTHYYPLSIQLDGALPPTFSGKHGSIRYILSSTLLRPLFYSDVNTIQEIEIKRCLVDNVNRTDGASNFQNRQQDLGSLLLNQLSIASFSNNMSDIPTGPTTITHHNTHKELLRYTSSSPPIAHLEGGLIQVDLTLEPLPPGSYIYSIAYGLKELIHYRSSATGNTADNKSEILYPIGQQTVIIPRDLERERAMSNAGAGASTRQLLELRPCPLLTNGDIVTPLVEVQHRITCNVAIVLPDAIRRRNTLSGSRSGSRGDSANDNNGTSNGGGGILRRLNLSPQPLAPSLNLVDSTGSEVANNAVLLGEPTLSIIDSALMPVTVELNDAPPLPPSTHIESTLLEFPIILTSRYHSPGRELISSRIEQAPLPEEITLRTVNNDDFAYHALSSNSYTSSNLGTSLHARPPVALVPAPASNLRFVHNQEIAPSVILTTGTTVQSHLGRTASVLTGSVTSSSTSRSSLEQELAEAESIPSSQGSPLATSVEEQLSASPVRPETAADLMNFRGTGHSGISAGLRAAAQYEQQPQPPTYGRQALLVHPVNHPPEDLPKYEDVMDILDTSESGLGITIPHSTPMPMPVPRRNEQPSSHSSFSPRFSGSSQSPVMYQPTSSIPRAHVFGSPPSSSPVALAPESLQTIHRDGQRSSPQWNRGHVRTDSAASMLMSTSLARTQGQSMVSSWSMTPAQVSGTQQQQHQRQHQHQRQRSVGAATIMGSLGRNGGYLSQQPVSLAMADSLRTPPAYVE